MGGHANDGSLIFCPVCKHRYHLDVCEVKRKGGGLCLCASSKNSGGSRNKKKGGKVGKKSELWA